MAEAVIRSGNLIGGEVRDAADGSTFESRNPAHKDEVIGVFARSGAADVEAAVAAAKNAFPDWRHTPWPARGDIILRAAEILAERKEELARLMTREMGKVLVEARGDVQEAIDMGKFIAGEGRRAFGETVPSELRNKWAMTMRQPFGVVGCVTPWNFPVAIPSWKLFPALMAGNTVVLKPAEVVAHPDVAAIYFTGSVDTGRIVAEKCGALLKKVSLELGGKNAIVVLDDADIELAVDGALWGAFGTAGQRCTASSRLVVSRAALGDFTDLLMQRVGQLKLGDGLDETVQVGPVINQVQLTRIHGYSQIGKDEGAKLLSGGEIATGGDLSEGWFYQPTVFTEVSPKMRVAQEEIFGPTTVIIPVDGVAEALAAANSTTYGLSLSVYTNDLTKAFHAIDELEAGIVYVNAPTIGAEIQLPFGGVKNTGNGHREAGNHVLDEFTEPKSIYIDYSGRLQRAQIDT